VTARNCRAAMAGNHLLRRPGLADLLWRSINGALQPVCRQPVPLSENLPRQIVSFSFHVAH
jgi:hypothetical protein